MAEAPVARRTLTHPRTPTGNSLLEATTPNLWADPGLLRTGVQEEEAA